MYSTDVYCSKQTGNGSTKTTSPIISSFLELGRKLSVRPKFVAAQKMLLKRNPANIRKWIARFYYFRHFYTPLERVCIAHNNCMSCRRYDALSALLINILLGSFQLFLHSDQPLSEGEIIRSAAVSASRGCIIHAGGEGSFTHWLTDCFDNATDDDQQQHHHAEHHFQL